MTERGFSADRSLRAFAQALKIASSLEAVGGALVGLSGRFRMPHLFVTDVTKVVRAPLSAAIYSARSLADLRQFLRGRPLATHPVFRRSWFGEDPFALSEIRDELNLSDGEFWELMPPWARGNEALSVNMRMDERSHLNFSFAGIGADTSGDVRSFLHLATRMACERLTELEREEGTAARLTPREEAVLQLLAAGKADEDIAKALGISARTARFHVANAKAKLGVATRMQAVLTLLRKDRL